MANFSVSYIVKAIDKFSDVVNKMDRALGGFNKKIATTHKNIEKLGKGMVKMGKNLSLKVSAPLIAAGTMSVHTADKFEQSMERMRVTANLTNKQFFALENQAKQLGATTDFTASKVAAAQAALAEKGFNFNQIMKATPPALTLASAATLDVGDAAQITAKLMKGYSFSAKDMISVNDKLAFISTRTNMDLSTLANGVGRVKATTDAAGMSFTDVLGTLAALDNQGIDVRQSMSGLRTALQYLIKPSTEALKLFKATHIKLRDTHDQLLPLTNIIDQFNKKIVPSKREQAAMIAFGQTGGAIMANLIQAGAPAIQAYVEQMKKMGDMASKLANVDMKDLSGATIRVKRATDLLAITFGTQLTPSVDILLNKFAALEIRLAHTSKGTQGIIGDFIYFGAALAPILLITGKFIVIMALIADKVPAAAIALRALGLSFKFLWKSIFAPIAVITTIIGLFDLAYKKITMFRNAVTETAKMIEKLFKHLTPGAMSPFGAFFKLALHHVENLKTAMSHVGIQAAPPTTATPTTGMARHAAANLLAPSVIKQAIKSSLEINVNDPNRVIHSITGKSDGDMDFNLGQSMMFARV